MTATAERTSAPVSREVVRAARRRRRGRFFGLRVTAAIVITLIMLFPLYWMVVTSLSPQTDLYDGKLHWWPAHFTVENYTLPFQQFPVWTWFRNSTVITLAVTAITTVANLLAGYAFAKMRFPFRNGLFLILLSTMMVPVQAVMVAQFKLSIGLGLFGNIWAVIIPESATVFGIFLARQFFLAIPDELLEAARCDGAGQLRTFVRIVLPLSKPLIAVLVLLTAMSEWNSFAWPLGRAVRRRQPVHPAHRHGHRPAGAVLVELWGDHGDEPADDRPHGDLVRGLPAILRPGLRP